MASAPIQISPKASGAENQTKHRRSTASKRSCQDSESGTSTPCRSSSCNKLVGSERRLSNPSSLNITLHSMRGACDNIPTHNNPEKLKESINQVNIASSVIGNLTRGPKGKTTKAMILAGLAGINNGANSQNDMEGSSEEPHTACLLAGHV